MNKLVYPLVITDFDGTLVKEDGTISERTKNTIKKYILDGGKFCICSGRMLPSVLARAREMEINGLSGAFQGALIAETNNGKVLVEGGFTPEEAAEVCLSFEKQNLHIQIYARNNFYSNKDDDALKMYERICGVKAEILQEKASDFARKAKFKILKVLAVVEEKDKQRIFERVQKEIGDKYYITYSAANLIEASTKEYSKGTAVKFMADYYKIPLEKTLAAGDSFNDLPMLTMAGRGIAVANCDISLKESVEVFDKTNEEDAVAEMIERYAYAKESL